MADYGDILQLFGSTAFHEKALLDQYIKSKKAQNQDLLRSLRFPFIRMSGYLNFLKSPELIRGALNKDAAASALEMVGDLMDALDAQQTSTESIRQCLEIQHSLHGLKYPVVDPSDRRKFGGCFLFAEIDTVHRQQHNRHFYVFNDIVIVANLKKRVLSILDIKQIDVQYQLDVQQDAPTVFTLITGTPKPMQLSAKEHSHLVRFQQLIEMGRDDSWKRNRGDADGSPGSSMQNQLA